MRANTLIIRTPERIEFSLALAGPVTRFLAWLIDLMCLTAGLVLIWLFALIVGWAAPDFVFAIATLVHFAVQIGYGIATEWLWRGQTFGKRVMRLRVMDASGLRLRFSQIAIRNLLRFVDSLPGLYLVGGSACLLTRRSQRLGDLAASTIVVRQPRFSEPDLRQVLPGKYNSFRDHPHLAARLRQRATPQDAAVALQALLRRDDFDPAARVALFADLVRHFRELTPFPQEATDGLADEQYIRNVVDVLYRPQVSPRELEPVAPA